MKALITGASSGIGREIALYLSDLGYDIIVVARNERALKDIQREVKTKVEVVSMDLTDRENVWKLHEMYKNEPIEVLVNNAGFGVFGKFTNTDLDREIQLIQTNITAVHILTKLFLKDMVSKNSGYILNVASIAGHLPGPLMATYYASKHYVYTLSTSINEELKKDKLNVRVGTLNPGPVRTNFNNVANVKFELSSLSSEYVARYTVKKMLKGCTDITPGSTIKFLRFIGKITPDNISSKIVYKTQKRKERI